MISFYPGPSKTHPKISAFMQEAVKTGILSANHRSREFVELSKQTVQLLKNRLNIPSGYTIFFTSSATECWEIIAQSVLEKKSMHLYNGAFGEKWFEYTRKIKPESSCHAFEPDEVLPLKDIKISKDTELICLVQNETSNGTQIQNKTIAALRKLYPRQLIAIDATSSMAGIKLDFKQGDIWFASVQKCFGLPAGLGILICSPSAIEKTKRMGENNHYNSLLFMDEKMKEWQTTYTPNVLGIFLLNRVMQLSPGVHSTDIILRERMQNWLKFFEDFDQAGLLIKNKHTRSDTVLAIEAKEDKIRSIKEKAKKEGILLGNGYGRWSSNTFRIANFPALTDKDIRILKKFLRENLK